MLSLPGSTLPPKRGDSKGVTGDTVSTSSNSSISNTSTHASTSRQPRISPASPSVFIPRTSRTSTGFKKPVSQMTTTELQALIERNESVLHNESVYSKLKDHQRRKLEEDLEVARRRLERWIGMRGGPAWSVSVTPAPMRDDMDQMSSPPRHENGADVKRRLFNEIVPPTHPHPHTHTSTQLLSNTESTSIQTRLYNEAQEEIQQRKILRGLELMTGLGRRLGDASMPAVKRASSVGDDDDEDHIDVEERYTDDVDSGDDGG